MSPSTTSAEVPAQEASTAIRSPLRHLDPEAISTAARIESRNREVHLPPISVYRWWARRTESVNGAVLDGLAMERPGQRLLVADPFSGGAVIPLSAVIRGHRVYAQDLNPWAVYGMAAMLGLPSPKVLEAAGERLHELSAETLRRAYGTSLSNGSGALISHTFRVATAPCTHCGERQRLFPHALVSLLARRERGRPEAFLACPAGHLFRGHSGGPQACPQCNRATDPGADYTRRRTVTCINCGHSERLRKRAETGKWTWEVVLVERASERARELALPTRRELEQAERAWTPELDLGEIPEGQETGVLRRHGFERWHDLYPNRQRLVLERLLALSEETTDDDRVLRALRLAIIGSAEMAGHLSRWDRFYLKSYESMAGHRFNFTTFTAEPNVWGTKASGRGTVSRRLRLFAKASAWLHERTDGRDLRVEGPLDAASHRSLVMSDSVDVRTASGSSKRMLLPVGASDIVLTDPPYHDDVEYDELSLPLRAWAGLSLERLDGSASVNQVLDGGESLNEYEALLTRIFSEARRCLKAQGHLIFSYANREPGAWQAVLAALEAAGLQANGYAVVHSENEVDVAKRDVRACSLDLIMDLVPAASGEWVQQWKPSGKPGSDEEDFLRIVGVHFLKVGKLPRGWRDEVDRALRDHTFLASARPLLPRTPRRV